MDSAVPTLEVGFAIDPEGSFDALIQLQQAMDTTEGRIVAEAAKIERATAGMVNVAGATASITSFGSAATRELQNASREMAKVEKSGEALVRSLERQASAFGLTRSELRGMKAEAAAVAAEQQGLIELAGRIRKAETEIFAKEFAAGRKAQMEAEAAAEERALADRQREIDLIAKKAAAERALAEEQRRQISILAERAHLESAIQRNTGLGQTRATDTGAGFSALAAHAAEEDARAQATAAAAAERLAREHGLLAAEVRASAAAQEADAVAADRLRASTDPLYAATARLNAEIAESTRLYQAGMTAPEEYARQQLVLKDRLQQTSAAHDLVAGSARKNGFALTNLSFQLNDVITMAASGAKPFQILATQGGQIFQAFQMAEGGAGALARQIGVLALAYAPLLAAVAVAGSMFYALNQNMQDDAALKKYSEGLGLTHKEMKKLGDVSVTTGDMLNGFAKTLGFSFEGVGSTIKGWIVDIGNFFGNVVKGIGAATYGLFVGSYRAIVETWRQFPAMLGDLFVQGVNGAIAAINVLLEKAVEGLNWFAQQANRILPASMQIPALSAPQIATMKNEWAGAGKGVGDAWGRNLNGAVKEALDATDRFMGRWTANSQQAARDRLKKKADEIIADRTPEKPKVDHHAEQLAREAAAIEAQIRNLYALADAYAVSGAAALIAEARVKAESQAIKQRADIEAAVDRQVRLAVAQRVSDAAKASATMRDQADVQEAVNAAVAGGLVPAERAADLVRDRIAELPLLAALEAAKLRGDVKGATDAARALETQAAARARLTKAETEARANAAIGSSNNQLAALREELRLIGATDEARARALATLKAQQEVATWTGIDPVKAAEYVKLQGDIAAQAVLNTQAQNAYNDALTFTADKWDIIAGKVQSAASGMADAFGSAGRAIGDLASIYANYQANRARADHEHSEAIKAAGGNQAQIDRENLKFALRSSGAQIEAFGDAAAAAKGFFKEGSSGYKALATAEKAFRAVQFALSLRAIAQDAIETGSKLATSAARTAAGAVEAVVNAIKSLPFPLNLAAGAATVAALASIGVAVGGMFGGGGSKPAPSNTGTGTVLGDSEAKSESIKRAIDALKEVDTLTNTYARQMAASLRSIDSQIGNVASLVTRAGNIDASAGVDQGFKTNAIGSVLKAVVPLFGGFIGSLFGTKTTVVGSGLFGGPQSLGSILNGGFDASYYSDVQKKKKFLGLTTSTKYRTEFAGADPTLENQFTLILRSFSDAIAASAGPLGLATGDVQARLQSFVVSIGKIDLKDLTGEEIQEKLSAIFGAAADQMAAAAIPGLDRFQKVGEGAFETLVRVASTVEAVTNSLGMLGTATAALGIDAKMGLADQFDTIGDLTGAVSAYFDRFYSKQEQAAAQTSQLNRVFSSLGLTIPASLAAFRQLVEAQNLTTEAGRATYATLLQLAPAFADLQQAMDGAKSAADILSERTDLERKLLEVQGNTAALRALDLAKLDASNRGLQQQIWALQDAQEAAKAADELRKAWGDIGKSIMDEVKRIRGLTDPAGGTGFASLMGQFNASTSAARAGDQDAAKLLPGLSQAVLKAAADAATSRQELDRVQAQIASSLEATFAAISAYAGTANPTATADALLAAMSASQGNASATTTANDNMASELAALRQELASMRTENNAGHAANASANNKTAKVLETVTAQSGGEAISVAAAA
jgi:hypothetical protein